MGGTRRPRRRGSSATTTTSRSGGRVWAATASRTSGSRPTRVAAPAGIPESVVSTGGRARGSRPGRGGPPSLVAPRPRGARTRWRQESPDAQRGAARASSSRGRVRRGHALDRALLQLAALALGQPAPDAEALVVGQGVLEALGRGPRSRRRPSWPRGWSRPSRGRTPPGPSGRTASAPARRARPRPRLDRCSHDQLQLVHGPSSTLARTVSLTPLSGAGRGSLVKRCTVDREKDSDGITRVSCVTSQAGF